MASLDVVLDKMAHGLHNALETVKSFAYGQGSPPLKLWDALTTITAAGFLAYLTFKRWEPTNLFILFFLLILIPGALSSVLVSHFGFAAGIVLSYLSYWSTILVSVTFYRLSPFHPLAHYPGPIPAKLTKFWGLYKERDGKQHLYVQSLHEMYGDVVRIGPNEISIRDCSVVQPLMGTIGCPKGPNWRARAMHPPVYSLITVRDPLEHARRRRPWNRAFNTAALKEYETIVAKRAIQLVESISNRKGVIDLAQWISFFTYDFMGDMVFGGGTEMLRDGDIDGSWEALKKGVDTMMIFDHLPWLSYIAKQFPTAKSIVKLRKRAMARTQARYDRGATSKDLFYYLSNEDGAEKISPSKQLVLSDGLLATVAGSDTTASVLSNTFWLLLRHPHYYKRLQAEVDRFYPPGSDSLDPKHHPQMSYLEAVIQETLRLYPVVPSGSQRAPIPGTGGKVIGPYYLPDGCMARVHFWSLQRNPRYFTYADTWYPDRWLIAEGLQESKEPLVHNLDAFIPFSFGPANCVGKNLALTEMRMVMCHVIQNLELSFPEGYDPMEWDRQLEDRFVVKVGKLPVIARRRAS